MNFDSAHDNRCIAFFIVKLVDKASFAAIYSIVVSLACAIFRVFVNYGTNISQYAKESDTR
ncbi:hypothetical protein T12_14268 [Trichinella patagoniensis]|uniref:Uncharacterized protein n=1 Tax=Trichinella patagoniensis TaxID=990121 RepID=A0A0V0ZBR0_9BILA|nr:hypothetical protein T12_14268 [Trichinella patagoniensis]